MGRKSASSLVVHTEADEQSLIDATNSASKLSSQYQVIAQHFGYQLAYNKDRMVDEVRHYMGESARTMLEAGARLALIRSQEPHGEWAEVCQSLNLEIRTAQRMISSASKFSNATTSSHLEKIGTSKIFELLVLDDDDAAALAAGDAIDGLGNIDDVEKMTVRELRAALRDLRQDSSAKDSILAAKSKKIDALETALQRKKSSTPAEEWLWAPHRRSLLDACESLATFAQTELRKALVDIQTEAETQNGLPEDIEALQSQSLSSVMQTLVELQKDFNLSSDLESIAVPPWMADFKPTDKKSK